jgi:dinuclear metal center YbgI/SA1388 family protein
MQLQDVLALLDRWYPPHLADSWDAVGLVCGDPAAEVRRVLLAVDPVQAVADEAVEYDADLVVVHHPLFLKGVHGVAATTPKGRVVHQLLSHGCALFAAHTNADAPVGGVSESMAMALGLEDVTPLEPDPQQPLVKLVVFAPADAADHLRQALADAGAGRIGDYDSASFSSVGTGRFRPLDGAHPAVGSVGSLESVAEERIEVIASRHLGERLVEVVREVHPYEEPAYDVYELAPLPDRHRGSGRLGRLPGEMSLREFAGHVAAVLPGTAHGVRVAGDPERPLRTVALCGGAGDFLLDRARAAGADAYVTSDLRHHPASELLEHPDAPALLDVAHWAAEWTWLPVLRDRLAAELADTVDLRVSTTNTDPWTFRADPPMSEEQS